MQCSNILKDWKFGVKSVETSKTTTPRFKSARDLCSRSTRKQSSGGYSQLRFQSTQSVALSIAASDFTQILKNPSYLFFCSICYWIGILGGFNLTADFTATIVQKEHLQVFLINQWYASVHVLALQGSRAEWEVFCWLTKLRGYGRAHKWWSEEF